MRREASAYGRQREWVARQPRPFSPFSPLTMASVVRSTSLSDQSVSESLAFENVVNQGPVQHGTVPSQFLKQVDDLHRLRRPRAASRNLQRQVRDRVEQPVLGGFSCMRASLNRSGPAHNPASTLRQPTSGTVRIRRPMCDGSRHRPEGR